MQEGWDAVQQKLVALSTNSQQVIVDSSHNIHIDQPQHCRIKYDQEIVGRQTHPALFERDVHPRDTVVGMTGGTLDANGERLYGGRRAR